MNNKTERFSYEGGCGIRERTHIEALKKELAWGIDKRLQIISNNLLFKTVKPLRN